MYKKEEKSEDAKKLMRNGIAIFVVGILVVICGVGALILGHFVKPETQSVVRSPLPASLASPAILDPDCWYTREQMVPSTDLGNDPTWKIVLNGKTSDDGINDSVDFRKNTVTSRLARSLEANFFVDIDDSENKVQNLNYLKNPVTIEPGKLYTIEFDCTKYNALNPIDRDTMRYYIAPLEMNQNEAAAVTFALYQAEKHKFHQICVPFMAKKNIEIDYCIDETFEEESLGQVYRLYIEAAERK